MFFPSFLSSTACAKSSGGTNVESDFAKFPNKENADSLAIHDMHRLELTGNDMDNLRIRVHYA